MSDSAPVPFFEDPRTLTGKLNTDQCGWKPHKESATSPAMIFGLVTERGTYTSDYNPDDRLPTVRILTAENVEWSIIGFHGYLRSELEREDPQAGDFAAFAYKGVVPAKRAGDSDAYNYQVEVERNPNRAVDEAISDSPAGDGDAEDHPGDSDIPF